MCIRDRSGALRWRPQRFERALGTEIGARYRQGLVQLLPAEMQEAYPRALPAVAGQVAEKLGDLLERVLDDAEAADPS